MNILVFLLELSKKIKMRNEDNAMSDTGRSWVAASFSARFSYPPLS